ncbi:MAG: PD-(D/E)XK nuclease family protein [Bacteroidetes bacterium]|nr:PD-(D/E)XK nuclease family protein [Bacteroidota bacterium]
MNELDIDKIVDLVLASVVLPNLEKQKGSLTELNSSSLLVGGVKELLWFNFYGSASRAAIWDHWTGLELDWLKQEGLLYDEASQCAKRQFYFLRNWIKYVTDKVIFVIPNFVNGETPQPHPFMPYMESLFEDLQSITFNYQVPSDVRLLKGEKLKIVEKRLDLIPSFPVYWKIGNDNILLNEPRESGESHNSLIKLLKYPYQWVLEYKAKLKRDNVITFDSMYKYLGNLSHHLYEELLTISDILTMPKTVIDQLYARQLEIVISENGLRLYEFGQESYLAAFKNKLLFNFHILLQHIVSGGWSIIGCELTETKEIQGICINGKCDLLLQRKYNGLNQTCVMDLKYSGAKKYRGLMEKGEDLQLAIYSKLFETSSQDSPTAYYIIEQGSLFTRDISAFPNGVLVNSHSNNSVLYSQLIRKLVKTILYRRDEIMSGSIEVGEDVLCEKLNIFTDCDNDSHILPEVVKMKKTRSKYNDFTTFIDTE